MHKTFKSPSEIFGPMFAEFHMSEVLEDGKAITDAIPKMPPSEIIEHYKKFQQDNSSTIESFFIEHFEVVESPSTGFISDKEKPVTEHILSLWDVLTRQPDNIQEGDSLIALPFPYVVPGGRFNEIYYWDSYFTMLGLEASNQIDLIESMIKNFAFLIDQVGFIPNGNRNYFTTRSQPPFFSLMIDILAKYKGEPIYVHYLPQLLTEYEFWNYGNNDCKEGQDVSYHSVLIEPDVIMNRYFDLGMEPRPEMFKADVELVQNSTRAKIEIYQDLRAACESGWDFSSRWMKKENQLESINTRNIVAVDLNCLLYHLEKTISKAFKIKGNRELSHEYERKHMQRKEHILKYCWNESLGIFCDFDIEEQKPSNKIHAACMFPLFFGIASESQAERSASLLEKHLLKAGGIVTTPIESGQQWDSPNGWAPLQWIAIEGLRKYGMFELSQEIKERWTKLNISIFKQTGKLLEKYNVVDPTMSTGGGEYPVQDGFGWTNGVLMKLLTESVK